MEQVPLNTIDRSYVSMRSSTRSLDSSMEDRPAADVLADDRPDPIQPLPNPDIGNTLYFRDGRRRIDYVLAYSVNDKDKLLAKKRAMKREEFEKKLTGLGIDLEHEPPECSSDGKVGFVKLHGTWNYMKTQAEVLKIRMPLKINDVKMRSKWKGMLERLFKRNPFKLNDKNIPQEHDYFTAVFDRRYMDQFVMHSEETFFTPTQRSRMIWDTLLRTEYGKDRGMGIKRLVKNGTYNTAYPLHEEVCGKGKAPKGKPLSERQILYESWAHPCRFYKYQPLRLIRKYFGEKLTIYFAWLGFYTKALIPAAIAGVLCIIYGLVSLKWDVPSKDICDGDGVGRTWMCPNGRITDGEPWNLSKSCFYSEVTYVFDNNLTVIFAVFMSVWATMFLEGWKRRQAELAWEWDMHDSDVQEETIRPEYQSSVKTLKMNPITHELEPYLPLSKRAVRLAVSLSTVFFFLCLVLAFVFGIIIYRTIISTLLESYIPGPLSLVTTTASAAVLNLIVIVFLDYAYQQLAWHLTNWEFPRTDQQFEDSYTLKVFLFQFINYYSSLFYIAFFKGRFHSVIDKQDKDAFGRARAEACDPSGCMVELVIQLAIIMVGKQVISNFWEIFLPVLCTSYRSWRRRPSRTIGADASRWDKDYHLNEVPPLNMFFEYMEMVLQYGFLTMFVAGFPLAPLFALTNNIMEIRLDAYKFLVTYRRPMPARAKNLGIWYKILDFISHAAVVTNACVIAFTSDFVPRMYYKYYVSGDQSMTGYVEHSLSKYYTKGPCLSMNSNRTICSEPYCHYRDHRLSPCNETGFFSECDPLGEYRKTTDWWYILVARLIFVLVFEHVVFLFKMVIAYVIPDIPQYVVIQMQRESYLAKQALYKRAVFTAGSSDVEQREGADKEIAGGMESDSPLIDKKSSGHKSNEFRYSPVDSIDMDEAELKKKAKFPGRRLKL